jgi:hypothetical protein
MLKWGRQELKSDVSELFAKQSLSKRTRWAERKTYAGDEKKNYAADRSEPEPGLRSTPTKTLNNCMQYLSTHGCIQ